MTDTTKIPVNYFKSGMKVQKDSKKNWLEKHGGSCQKIYLKTLINGREFKIIQCLKHGDMFVE